MDLEALYIKRKPMGYAVVSKIYETGELLQVQEYHGIPVLEEPTQD
jgi:hypothetical protein